MPLCSAGFGASSTLYVNLKVKKYTYDTVMFNLKNINILKFFLFIYMNNYF